MAEQDTAPQLRMVCGKCGSDEVTRDAWAEWNVEAQGWGLGAVFEQAFCHRCQASTRIVEAPLPDSGAGPDTQAGRTDP
jgi:ribosomal protein S27AE